MVKSVFSDNDICVILCQNILELLNKSDDFLNQRIVNSPRSVGDTVQLILEEELVGCMPADVIKNYNSGFARRAMADFAFCDMDDNYYVIDNKTHNEDTSFNMPNLTSVERVARLYEDDKNYFCILLVTYKNDNGKIIFTDCSFFPIEYLAWDCLTIGALGWGQLQIANSNKIIFNREMLRKEWMLSLCDRLDVFYPREIEKINNRLVRFQSVREFWNKHT
jgi:hypothetical protein